MRWRILAWIILLCYWLILVSLTHMPPRMIPLAGISDKFMHILAYWGLTLFIYTALWATFPRRSIAIFVIAVVLIHGALDEWTQSMVGRSAEFLDWVADLIGALTGVGLMRLVRYLAMGSEAPPPPLPPMADAGPMYAIPSWSQRDTDTSRNRPRKRKQSPAT